MPRTSVICVAKTESQAISILDQLKTAAFPSDDLSALLPDENVSATGGVIADMLGGALRWLASLGAQSIPEAGLFIAAGPIMEVLRGSTTVSIAEALIVLGVPESEARRYEGKVRHGNILISVHTGNPAEIKRAKQIFKGAGAEDVSCHGKSAAPQVQETVPSKNLMLWGTAAA